jgi:hypothetical protein
MIEIFCNIPLNNVLMIRANDIDKITQNINTLFEKEPKFIDRFVKKGIKFGGIGAALGIGAYAAGASSRRYAKAPKPGEGRDLRNQIVSQPDIRTYFK